jgi:hypothetical protein
MRHRFVLAAVALTVASTLLQGHAQTSGTAESAASVKQIGTIQAIDGNSVTITTDAGAALTLQMQDSTRLLRIAPGQKDLKQATPLQLPDLQTGDRVLVRGKPADDGKSVLASSVIVMSRSDIQENQRHIEDEWRQGVGGPVRSADPATGIITISVMAAGGPKLVTIHTSKDTVERRYAPNSVKYSDSITSTINQIKPGDQLHARGTKSPDGDSFAAQEIVSGSFQNIAGTVIASDAAASKVTVMDLATKRPVTVKVTPDSQLRQLPPMVAQMLAMRLKNTAAGAAASTPGAGGGHGSGGAPEGRPAWSGTEGRAQGGPPGTGRPAGGPPDLQRLMSRLPIVTVGDLKKGEAVLISSTGGAVPGEVTAVKLLSGVEPILSAAPAGSEGMVLNWSLGGGGAESAPGGTP